MVLFCKVCIGRSFSNIDLIFRPNMASAGDRASGMLGFAMILVDLEKLLKGIFRKRAISFL